MNVDWLVFGVLVWKYFFFVKKLFVCCICIFDIVICFVKCNIKSYSFVYYDILMVYFEMYENILYLFIIEDFY